MSAKLLNVFGDENPDVHKQIGCMSGIFQMFDRHHLLTGRRQNHHKRLTSGYHGSDPQEHSPKIVLEKNQSRSSTEKQRVSIESSRPSFSSSSGSSSFSSLECNKSTQQEHLHYERAAVRENPLKSQGSINTRPSYSCSSPANARRSLDFRDFVKDSMYRESSGLSVKTTSTEDVKKNVIKHKDSPRPPPMPKPMDGKSKMSKELDESLRVLEKLKEPRRSPYESKDNVFLSASKESPRFSYDSRENGNSAAKLRELPRLSLDSRYYDSASNSVMKDLERIHSNQRVARTFVLPQDSESEKRPPGVVAKLMGLEAMPNTSCPSPSRSGLTRSASCKDCNSSEDQRKTSRQDWLPSPKRSSKDSVTPQKPISSPRFPVETPPKRQQEKAPGSQKHESFYSEIDKKLEELEFLQSNKDIKALRQMLDSIRAKRMLEVKKSEEQSPGAAKEKLYNCQSPIRSDNSKSANRRNLRGADYIPTLVGESDTPRPLDSPIVIMKPARSVSTGSVRPSTAIPCDLAGVRTVRTNGEIAKERSPKSSLREAASNVHVSIDKVSNTRVDKNSLQRSQARKLSRESNGTSVKTSGSLSPRLQQRKPELEKKSRPPVPSSGFIKTPRQSRQPSESVSPRRKLKVKQIAGQQNDGHLSDIGHDVRNLNHQADIGLESRIDVESTTSDQSAELKDNFFQVGQNPPRPVIEQEVTVSSSSPVLKSSMNSREDDSYVEVARLTPEQPSPISVLDVSFYQDDLPPSPVKDISCSFKDQETQVFEDVCSEDAWNFAGIADPLPSTKIEHGRLKDMEILVEKLKQLSSSDSEAEEACHDAISCNDKNPNHRYITEILLASGLLKGNNGNSAIPTPIQLHHSGYAINPELFLVLEQNRTRCLAKTEPNCENATKPKTDLEKLHRKLMFDAVNELLVEKLELSGPGPQPRSSPWAGKLAGKVPTGQSLLKELYVEIDQLQAYGSQGESFSGNYDDDDDDGLKLILSRDVSRQTASWVSLGRQVSEFVLDIERSIFKDLVDDVVSSESAAISTRRRRQLLFAK